MISKMHFPLSELTVDKGRNFKLAVLVTPSAFLIVNVSTTVTPNCIASDVGVDLGL